MFYPQGRSTTRSMGESRIKIPGASLSRARRARRPRAFILLTRRLARPRL